MVRKASWTATLAPMVIQRWACPDTDLLVGDTPEALAYRKMVSAKPGEMVPIFEGHCFLSSTTKYKGPEVTRYMLETVMAWYAERGWPSRVRYVWTPTIVPHNSSHPGPS